MTQKRITDELQVLLDVLPDDINRAVHEKNDFDNLLEIIMDLGRVPSARFVNGEVRLRETEVTLTEIDEVVERVSDFDADNRAGIERTLHRISGIRNRRGDVVGLTCRIGRAVYGTIDIIQDLVESGANLLILGRPGIGKTTMLREAARILSEKKRVVIVDTSNEIGGDGDVAHPAVGQARRMQVAKPSLQHEVMIEAVENHNPEVIVIDEIGRELEAAAARTIAERGVQLIGTAHGGTLENLLLNPTLSDLIGGIESVTLSDEEARRRGTQKTVLERRSPPTFDVLIEIQERDTLTIHPDVTAAVDALVRGYALQPERRTRKSDGEIEIQKAAVNVAPKPANQGFRRSKERSEDSERSPVKIDAPVSSTGSRLRPVHIYPYGVARNRLAQAAKRLGVPAVVVRDPEDAEVLMTLRTYYRNRQQVLMEAEQRGMPIYILRANTINQMEQSLVEIFNLDSDPAASGHYEEITHQTQRAIEAVLNGQNWVDLPPAAAVVRRLQHDMARNAKLVSHSYGKEPRRRVRIYRE